MYLGSLTQAVRHELILQQIELERTLIGVVRVCSPANKHKSASVSVYAHITVPTNYSSSRRDALQFGWLCCGGTALRIQPSQPVQRQSPQEKNTPRTWLQGWRGLEDKGEQS